MFPIQNDMKEGYAVLSSFFNFSLEYAIRKVQANLVGLKLNETHWILIYPDDNLLGKKVHTVMTNTEALLVAKKEFGSRSKTGKAR